MIGAPRRIVLLLCILQGCRLDFVDVAADSPAYMQLQISAEDRTDRLGLDGSLDPGRKEGQLRYVKSDLVVLGHSVPATVTGGNSVYHANWNLSSALSPDSPITVRVPHVEGVSMVDDSVYNLYMPRRIGASKIERAKGEPVILRLHPGTTAGVENFMWRVQSIGPAGGLEIRSDGVIPSEIAIPADWLGSEGSSPLEIRVTVFRTLRPEHVTGSYYLDIRVAAVLTWTVHTTSIAN